MGYNQFDSVMSELSGHDCPRCNLELYIETSGLDEGADLLICKECWGVAVVAKSMESIITNGRELDEKSAVPDTNNIGCNCPICSTKMKEIELDVPEEIRDKLNLIDVSESKKVIIDSCENCPTFWFDAGELDLLNGIQPKLRGVFFEPESNRLIDDKTLTEEDLYRKTMIRKGAGFGVLVFAALIASLGEPVLILAAGILGIGGIIAMLSSDPEQTLAKGTCDKCLKENKSLAWNCQRGGCWAHICTDCQTVDVDPVEAYAKTLGKVAVGVVMVGIVIAVLPMGAGSLPSGAPFGASEKEGERPDWWDMLLCRECVEVAKEEAAKEGDEMNQQNTIEPISDGYCNYIDSLNGKKCKRPDVRDSGYCYVHK